MDNFQEIKSSHVSEVLCSSVDEVFFCITYLGQIFSPSLFTLAGRTNQPSDLGFVKSLSVLPFLMFDSGE